MNQCIKLIKLSAVIMMIAINISCQQDALSPMNEIMLDQNMSNETLEYIKSKGYSIENVKVINSVLYGKGYLVEGDVALYEQHFTDLNGPTLNIANEEQYRTSLLPVFGRISRGRDGQEIRRKQQLIVGISDNLPAIYRTALVEAANRYNVVPSMRFSIYVPTINRPTHDIYISRGTGDYLARSGPPFLRTYADGTTKVLPHGEILVNNGAIGNEPIDHIASILAHEIGHCIGFRHTDYFNRSISCGGYAVNEDDYSNDQAIHIPGTPTGVDNDSWMLACIDNGENRPFTAYDTRALVEIHGW